MFGPDPDQLKLLANFCSDFAKGLMLAAVVGQGFATEADSLERAAFSFIWITLGCISLYAALSFTKEAKL
jgi:hypothetical protein